MADISRVYEIRIEQGPALREFERLNKALQDNRAERTKLGKEVRDNIKQQEAIRKAMLQEGADAERLGARLRNLEKAREVLNRRQAEAEIVNTNLSATTRELRNDLGELTERQLRFRDKMAQATLEAIRQSGVLGDLAARSQSLKEELADVASGVDRTNKELAELNQNFQRGSVSEEEYRKELDRLNAELAQGEKAQREFADELGKVTKRSDELGRKVAELESDFRKGKISADEFKRGMASIDNEVKQLNGRIQGQGKELRGLISGYVGVAAAIYGVVNILRDATETIIEFDKGVARVRALGGEYAQSIEQLGEAAKTAGIDFGFGATQSIAAVEALAKAGVSVEDIIGGGLTGALTLASAGEIDLANAAETAASALTQFGLSGADVSRVADALVGGANAAQGGVDELRQALNQSGLVASQFGLSLEETVGTLTTFASAGLIGSDAGTSFRTMLLRIAKPSKEARAEIDRLGLELFNAKGEFVGIENLAEQFQDRLGFLTEEQRQASLALIFGQDAIRAANLLYQAGAEDVAKYTEAVSETGIAARVAAEQQETLRGSLDKLSAQWDATVLSIEDGSGILSRAFTGLTQNLTGILGEFTNANKEGATFGDTLESIAKGFVRMNAASVATAGLANELLKLFEDDPGELPAAEQARLLSKEFDLASASIGELETRLRLLNERRETYAGLNTQPGVVAAHDREIASLRGLIAERKKAADAAEEGAEKATEGAARQVLAAESVSQARERLTGQLREEQKAKEELAADDLKAIEASNKRIESIQAEIDALDGKSKALGGTAKATVDNTEAMQALADAVYAYNEAVSNVFSDRASTPAPGTSLNNLVGGGADFSSLLGGGNDEDAADADLQNEEANLAAKIEIWTAEQEAYQALQDAKVNAAEAFAGTLAKLSEQGSDAAQLFFLAEKGIAAAEVILKLQRELASYGVAGATQAILDPTAPARYAKLALAAKLRAGISLATIAGTALQGFAEGGIVDDRWGPRIRRSNGDNRLVRTGSGGYATLKDGEAVLNLRQQARVKAKTGMDIRELAELPGTRAKSALAGMRASIRDGARSIMPGYADGGIVNIPVGLPSTQTIQQNILAAGLEALADRPIYTLVEEIERGVGRQGLIRELSDSRGNSQYTFKKGTGG